MKAQRKKGEGKEEKTRPWVQQEGEKNGDGKAGEEPQQ